jgi:HK97 gp10 family phage protein
MSTRQNTIEAILVWNGDEVKRRAESLAKKSAFEIGLQVCSDAKMLCPVDTGLLRGSIQVASGDGKRLLPETQSGILGKLKHFFGKDRIEKPTIPNETFVGSPIEYAAYQEYGTIKTSAQPFLRPALDYSKGKMLDIVQIEAKKEFAEYLTPKDQWKQSPEGFTE